MTTFAQRNKKIQVNVPNRIYFDVKSISPRFGGMSGFVRYCIDKELPRHLEKRRKEFMRKKPTVLTIK